MANEGNLQLVSAERFAELWNEAAGAVSAYVAAEVRNRHDAEDVMQEIGRAVTQGAERYDPQRPFMNWVFGVARNQILRHYQRQSRERTVFSSAIVDQLADAYRAMAPTLGERGDALRDCLQKLSRRQRLAVALYYRDELSQTEIAEQMTMTASAVGVLIHRSRQALKDCIGRKLAAGAERP